MGGRTERKTCTRLRIVGLDTLHLLENLLAWRASGLHHGGFGQIRGLVSCLSIKGHGEFYERYLGSSSDLFLPSDPAHHSPGPTAGR